MNPTEQLYRELAPTPTLKEVLVKLRKTHVEEIDRLYKRVDAIDKRIDELELEEMKINTCCACGQVPSHYFHDPVSLNRIASGHEFVGRE